MKNIPRKADLKARRPRLFSLMVIAALTLTTVLTHSLDRARVMAGGAASPAGTITVTNTNDNGAGSLRDAIGAAASGDTIEFDATVFNLHQTITLTTGALAVAQNVTIQGPGANLLSVSGNNVSGVFDIPGDFSVTINAMTIRDAGDVIQGGGIMNAGSAMINDCVIRNNTAKQGGGVQNNGTMTINNSAILYNQSSFFPGGGIVTFGLLTVNNSIVAYNNSTDAVGGIWVVGSGGALTITNSTVSGNGTPTFGGGIQFDSTQQPNKVVNCTITNNEAGALGGGIYVSYGSVTLKNSIIASNVGGNCAGPTPILADGVNFSTDDTCAGFNQVTPQQLNLSPLQDNGGQTLTHALLAGSVAIDAVTDCTDKSNPPVALATDQRGVSRPQGAACDVGAFEAIPCTFTCPANITVLSDPNQCGAVVNYPAPTTTGDTCGTITCSPPSGAFFAIGTTTVSCNASGTATDPDCTFTVTVTDTQPPSITCPANIVGVATSPAGAVVNYSLPTVTDSCPGVGPPGCNPPSGSTFAIGVTTVNCTVSDAAGNSNACSFTVTVLTPAQAIQALIAGVQELVTAGALNPPQGTGLIAKLRDALDGLNRGNTRVACNKLADFISQVNALIGAGVLTSAEGVPLVQSATNIRNALGCS